MSSEHPELSWHALTPRLLKIVIGSPKRGSFAVVSEPPCCVGGDVWRVEERAGGIDIYWNGRRLCSMTRPVYVDGYVTLRHSLEKDEHVYGLGEKYARLDRRFKRFHFWNVDQFVHLPSGDPMYKSIPFYIVAKPGKTYGVFVDHPGYIYIDTCVEELDSLHIKVRSPSATMYIFAGGDVYEVLDEYTKLTGRPFMPPKWALGYHQCRYSYMSQEEVLDVAREFRHRGIPLDAIWLDIDYMDGYKLFTWNRERFPDPQQMIGDLHSMDIRVVTIVDIGIKVEKGYHAYERGLEVDAFLRTPDGELFRGGVWPGLCVFPDFLRKSVREYWAKLLAEFMSVGIDGIWLDMNEPAIFYMEDLLRRAVAEISAKLIEGKVEEAGNSYFWKWRHVVGTVGVGKGVGMVTIPAVHRDDSGSAVDHNDMHNAYALLENEATKRAFDMLRRGKRWFILTRSAYAGIQRLAALWTGDNQSDWGHMEISIPMILSLGLSGAPFVGADVGGFGDDTDPEMLLRWTQLGAFYPFFRNHSSKGSRRQEPWIFGEPWESYVVDAIKLRYRFLPYIYYLFVEAHRSGKPIARPLFAEFPDDDTCYVIDDEFLVGDALLVAPVLSPGKRARVVYLPGCRWLDYWTGKVFEPGWRIVEALLDRVPLFVRENKAVVTTDPKDSAAKPWERMYVETFLTSEAHAVLYDDDGESLEFENGKYFEALLRLSRRGSEVFVEVAKLVKGYDPGFKEVVVRILNGVDVENVWFCGEKLAPEHKNGVASVVLSLDKITACSQERRAST